MKSLLFLAGSTLAAGSGVPESDAYPLIEYWMANDFRSNPLCSDGEYMRATTFPFRRSVGLRNATANYLKTYMSDIRRKSTRDLAFDINQRRGPSDYDSLIKMAVKSTVTKKRQYGDKTAEGVGSELCGILGARAETDTFCKVMNGVTRAFYCQDNYAYTDPDRVYNSDLAPANDFGFELNNECLTPTSAAQKPLDLFIQQYHSTPDSLDLTVVGGERKVYYLLWKAIEKLERYSERKILAAELGKALVEKKSNKKSLHELYRDAEIFQQVLPEWDVLRVIYTNEPAYKNTDMTLRVPLAVVARRGYNLLVVVRRGLTNYDSRFTLYNQQAFKYLYNFTGQLHDGSATYFQSLLGPIALEVRKHVASMQESGIVAKLTFTSADSPGVGAVAALGNHLSRQFGDQLQVDVVGFGSPYFGDSEFLDSLRSNVELRVVQIKADSTDMLLCPTTYSCDDADLYIRTGIESGIEYKYAKAHGYVGIGMNELGNINDAWLDESAYLQVAAIRDCAYPCILAHGACRGGSDSAMCDPNNCESWVQL